MRSDNIEMIKDMTRSTADLYRGAGKAANPSKIVLLICGIQVETIEDPLMKKIRQLDKLVDELAKGRLMEKILR